MQSTAEASIVTGVNFSGLAPWKDANTYYIRMHIIIIIFTNSLHDGEETYERTAAKRCYDGEGKPILRRVRHWRRLHGNHPGRL